MWAAGRMAWLPGTAYTPGGGKGPGGRTLGGRASRCGDKSGGPLSEPRGPGFVMRRVVGNVHAARTCWGIAFGVLVFLLVENFPYAGSNNAKDWDFFYFAAEALVQGTDLYESGETAGYIYPPFLAFVLMPLVALGFQASAQVWFVVMVLATAWGVWVAGREALSRLTPARSVSEAWKEVGATVALAGVFSLNVARREFEHTQTDWVTVLAFTLSLVWMERRPVLAGIFLGAAANIKYHTLIVVPYLIVRGRYRMAASTLGSTIVFALLPGAVIGWGLNLDYLRRAFGGLAQFAGVESEDRANVWGLTHLDSISGTSALGRLAEGMGSQGRSLTVVLVALAASACLGVAWWMYRRHGRALFARPVRDAATRGLGLVVMTEWTGLIVATLVFSPQTLKRHMFLLVPVYAIAAAMLVRARKTPWVLLAGLAVSMLALVLPPRSEGMHAASDAWRAVGGASWGLLAMFFAMLWTSLEWAGEEARSVGAPVGSSEVSLR